MLFKRHSSWKSALAQPFRVIWKYTKIIFPARDVVYIEDGKIDSFQQKTWVRVSKFSGKMFLGLWALWATYIFVYQRPIMNSKAKEVEFLKSSHQMQMAELAEYQKKFADIHKNLIMLDEDLVKDNKSMETKFDLTKRVQLWAELDYIQAKLNKLYEENRYNPEYLKVANMTLDMQLTKEENKQLSKRNKDLEQSMNMIYEADSKLTESIASITQNNINAIEKDLRKIGGTLTSLGLNQNTLIKRAKKADFAYLGGRFTSTNLDKIENIDEKYLKLAEEIDLWKGLQRTKTILPVGNPIKDPYITSKYGSREHPINGKITIHKGIDFAGHIGTPLYAVAPGKVVRAGTESGYGKVVEIDHGLGFSTLYGHLSEIRVKKGDFVETKDVIGLGGNTGRSTGPHLHYEIRYNNAPFNPYTFVSAEKLDY